MPVFPITILIADADILTRNGLAKTLETNKDIVVAALTDNCGELITLCNLHYPDVIILSKEINSPGLHKQFAEELPGVQIIMMVNDNDGAAVMAMKAGGTHAYFYKSAKEEEILKTIFGVHEGNINCGVYNGYGINAVNAAHSLLTQREKGLLSHFCRDLTAKEIAAKENLSSRTVEKHKENIMQKLQVKGVAGMVLYAVRNNIYIATLLQWIMLALPADLQDIICLAAET